MSGNKAIIEDFLSHNGVKDAELSHYGVKGMRWGVRRGGLKSRVSGAILDRNQRNVKYLKDVKNKEIDEKGFLLGKYDKAQVNAARKIGVAMHFGEKRYQKSMDKQISKIEAQSENINSGKLRVRDVVGAVATISIAELAVSIRDAQG